MAIDETNPAPEPRCLTRVARYQRTIRASLARIWENVLDWEHLPWLHRTSFRAIRLIDADGNGWRARVTLPAETPGEVGLDVRLDRTHLRYLSRTVDGRGAGTEILTRLEPIDDRTTNIAVEFHLPEVPATRARSIGDAYVRLYTRLWDEDEAMMVRRQALLDGELRPHGKSILGPHALGDVAALRARLPLVVEVGGQRLRLVEVDGAIIAHSTICPHRGGPLDDAPIDDGCITCPWHGYRFDLRRDNGGRRDYRLDPIASIEVDAKSSRAFLILRPQ
ncbi:MAG TPA: Rieske 2Fe-2S domain-containing protein [Candidatus Kryptonia bacterium]|nr:Rieske 2Fe-2S domain-containing protein [Candidatus Kryptonia bacterium]